MKRTNEMKSILFNLVFSFIESDVQHSVSFENCDNVVCGHFLVFNSTGSCLALNWASVKSLVHPPTSKSCYRVDNSFLMTGDVFHFH